MARVEGQATSIRFVCRDLSGRLVSLRGVALQRFPIELVLAATMMLAASSSRAADADAVVQGRIRDSQGVPQMGVLVQVLTDSASLAGMSYTDLGGRYRVGHLLPGRYQVRASAVLFTPAVRSNLTLPAGARAAVDLTLTTIFGNVVWLPAERRRVDEPNDDWKWTLRSSASRPILRLTDTDDQMVLVSSSAVERTRPEQHAVASVTGGDGGFGVGGLHHRLIVDQTLEDGSDVVLRSDVAADSGRSGPVSRTPSASFDAGYQRRIGFAGVARTVVNFETHPEMRGTGGAVGLAGLRLANAERLKFGSLVDLEYGSALSVVRVSDTGVAARPFVRLMVHPLDGWTVGYRMATSRELQGFDALDVVQWETPVAALAGGKLAQEDGMHQEFVVSRADGRGSVQFAVYHDGIQHAALSGTGIVGADDLQRPGVQGLLVDSVTDNFRLLSGAYNGGGVRVTVSEPLTASMFVAFSMATGDALSTRNSGAVTLQEANGSMHVQRGQSIAVAVKGRVAHTGTKVRAAYCWQPRSMVTAIDPYGPFSDQAYLSFYLAQPIGLGGLLPHGLNAVIDATNIFGQGYQMLLSQQGHAVFLAEAPRSVQAGLSYTF